MAKNGKNRNISVLAAVVVGILVLIAAYFIFSKDLGPMASPSPSPTPLASKTYRNDHFEFNYPALLQLTEKGSVITLKHEVPFDHQDPCDFKGDAPRLSTVTDFNASLQLFDRNLEGTVDAKQPFLKNDILLNGQMKTNGLAEPYQAGMLRGFVVNTGAEGCGIETYYFPVETGRTLVVERRYSPDRTQLITYYEQVLALPGIITPEEEMRIFREVLSSVDFKDAAVLNDMKVKVFFANERIKPIETCQEVVAVERVIPKTEKVAEAALTELFKGPTAEEKEQGYISEFPANSRVKSIRIINGEARADFSGATDSGGGSCAMAMRVQQIRQTLLQFPTVKTVILSVEGKTEPIFQP
ncbi:MAG: GerMN domain-containing protein [bacterium]|nr:GerMN domain-containing protein [bacterium]